MEEIRALFTRSRRTLRQRRKKRRRSLHQTWKHSLVEAGICLKSFGRLLFFMLLIKINKKNLQNIIFTANSIKMNYLIGSKIGKIPEGWKSNCNNNSPLQFGWLWSYSSFLSGKILWLKTIVIVHIENPHWLLRSSY